MNSWKPKFLRIYKGNQKCNAFSKLNEENFHLSKDIWQQQTSFGKDDSQVNNQNDSICNDPKAIVIELFYPTFEEQELEQEQKQQKQKQEQPQNGLKNKLNKVYKRSDDVRLKISNAHKARGTKPTAGIKKGQTGESHPSYKHGQSEGRSSGYEGDKYTAWLQGVKKNCAYRCFITGETQKENLACHHLNAWNWCIDKRYDIANGILISKIIHKHFHSIFGNDVSTADFEKYLIKYQEWDKPFPWKQGNHEPSSSVEEMLERRVSFKEKKETELSNLLASREHFIIKGKYVNCKSLITIKCGIHDETFETTFHNYNKCKHDLRCCGKQAVKDCSQ